MDLSPAANSAAPSDREGAPDPSEELTLTELSATTTYIVEVDNKTVDSSANNQRQLPLPFNSSSESIEKP